MIARACGTYGGWGVEKVEETFGSYRIYDFLQFPSCAPCILCLDQEHQFEASDFAHLPQRLEQFDLSKYVIYSKARLDDNELGKHRGCDGREWFHGDDTTVVDYVGVGHEFPDLERSEDLETR